MTKPVYDTHYNVDRPCLIIDEETTRHKIESMGEKARKNKVIFRPHFKTHQSETIGKWFLDAGVRKITVSSVQMANYFANAGWSDITISTPLNLLQLQNVLYLAQKINLNIVVENQETIVQLVREVKTPIGVFLEIDTGNKRSGMHSSKIDEIVSVCRKLKNNKYINFQGLLVHSGHTYNAKTKQEIKQIYDNDRKILISLKNELQYLFDNELIISIGDTPGCVTVNNLQWADEIRPGNFVFYDLMQWKNGICQYQDISCVVACPIISIQKDRNEIVIYGGAVHFSKENLQFNDHVCYGLLAVNIQDDRSILQPDPNSILVQLWQEHGIIKTTEEIIKLSNVGDLIYIFPVHSCLTLDAIRYCRTNNGNKILIMTK